MKLKALHIFILFQFFLPGVLLAVEPAPDITDREVIEKLAKLESGQQALNQRISDLRSEMKTGQENLPSEMKTGQDSLRSEMKTGQENLRSEMKMAMDAMNKRLDDMSQRISSLTYVMVRIFGAVAALIAVLAGLILWDRRTTVKPLVEKVERLERDVSENLYLSDEFGLKVNRLIKALREIAATDDHFAKVLRSCSLL